MTMLGTVSGSKPARRAKSSAVRSTVSTLSIVEPSVRETRLVVESGNGHLDAGTGRGLDASCGNDGSLLVELSNVKVVRRMRSGDSCRGVCKGSVQIDSGGGSCTTGWGRMRVRGFARATRAEACL
jgi:hypothetical protein